MAKEELQSLRRRAKRVLITDDLIRDLITTGSIFTSASYGKVKVVEGLPEDAVLVGLHYNAERNTWNAVYYSYGFDEVKEGDLLPELTIKLRGIA